MTSEELKMVSDALANIASGGKDAFMWWVVARYGTELLVYLLVVGFFSFVAVVVARTMIRLNTKTTPELDNQEQLFIGVRRVWLDNGIPDVISQDDAYRLFAKLLKHMDKKAKS